jgi:thioredoxin 1
MKLKPIWIIILSIAIISTVAFYKIMQPPITSVGERSDGTTAPHSISLTSGRVTMIDLGATECIPCKMMAPILEELEKEYEGRADIIFIDVWKAPDQAKKFGIRAIPTQIFFDIEGREFYRHTGFMDKKSIVDILSRMGVS